MFSALAVARHVAGADAAVVAMGPGIVGTNTRLGFSGMEVGPILDAAHALGGVAIACLRVSFADGRDRHVGLSHHSATALRLAARDRALVAVPELPARAGGAAARRPRAPRASTAATTSSTSTAPDALELFDRFGLHVASMGRPAADDPALFQAAVAAGTLAAATDRSAGGRWLTGSSGSSTSPRRCSRPGAR